MPKKIKLKPNTRYQIDYIDKEGEYTERVIKIISTAKSDYGEYDYIEAYCELRHDIRHFRTDRIIPPVIEVKTGKMIDFYVDDSSEPKNQPEHDFKPEKIPFTNHRASDYVHPILLKINCPHCGVVSYSHTVIECPHCHEKYLEAPELKLNKKSEPNPSHKQTPNPVTIKKPQDKSTENTWGITKVQKCILLSVFIVVPIFVFSMDTAKQNPEPVKKSYTSAYTEENKKVKDAVVQETEAIAARLAQRKKDYAVFLVNLDYQYKLEQQAIDRREQRQKMDIESSVMDDTKRSVQITDVILDANRQRVSEAKKFADEKIAVLNSIYNTELSKKGISDESVKQLNKQRSTEETEILKAAADTIKKAIGAMVGEEQLHNEAVRSLAEQRKKLEIDSEIAIQNFLNESK